MRAHKCNFNKLVLSETVSSAKRKLTTLTRHPQYSGWNLRKMHAKLIVIQ